MAIPDRGPTAPVEDALSEVRFELLSLNDQIRQLLGAVNRLQPQITVEPTPVVFSPTEGTPSAVDLSPLLEALDRLSVQRDERGVEELQGLRKDIGDLGTALRHIVGSAGGTTGIGASVVTAGADLPVVNSATNALHVTVDSMPAGGASSDVTDRAGRLLGHVTVDTMPSVTVNNLPATQPVSATSWPLPTGAAQDATLTGGSMKTKLIDSAGTNAAAISAAGALKVDNSGQTQPVSGTVALGAGAATIGSLAANQSVNNAQVNGSAVVTSVTGVQDVMPRKRNGASGLSPQYSASHITTKTTTTVTAATAYISTILIATSNAGTAMTIAIQNKEATPKLIYPATTAAVGVVQLNFTEPILATSGIDIITAGTTAGVVDVFVTYWQ